MDNAGYNKLAALTMTPAWTHIIITAISLIAVSSEWLSLHHGCVITLDTAAFTM